MKTHQIKINVPVWLVTPFRRTSYLFRKWKYWAFPDHCGCCGDRMYVRSFEIEHYFPNGQRLMVGNHPLVDDVGARKIVSVCRKCIAKQLETEEWKPRFSHLHEEREGKPSRYNYRFWSTKKCDITGEFVRSYKDVEVYPYVDMTFCTYAWNASHVSKQAVIECVKNGKIKTSIWGIHKGKMAPTNHKGLFIDEKGKLL